MAIIQAQKDSKFFIDQDFKLEDVSEQFVGRKGYSMFKLQDNDVPVPRFFCISSSIFTEHLSRTITEQEEDKESATELVDKLRQNELPEETRSQLKRAYSRISGFSDSWVAVRSSVVLPSNREDVAFAGMLKTVLNVRGVDSVVSAVKEVYSSLFTDRVANYLNNRNLMLSDVKVAIVVQKMVQSEVSGIAFTVDPISQNEDMLAIESVFGLGDVIAEGDISPDLYVLKKEDLSFEEKRIVPQEWMMVRRINAKPGEKGVKRVTISKAWQHQQKLENRYIEELAKIAMHIEETEKKPQDIEWTFESGKIWILQTKNIQPVKIPHQEETELMKFDNQIIEAAKEIAHEQEAKSKTKREIKKKKRSSQKKAEDKQSEKKSKSPRNQEDEVLVSKPFNRQIIKSSKNKKDKSYTHKPGERLLITGIGASDGMARGNVVVATSKQELERSKEQIDQDTLLIYNEHYPEIENVLTKVAGIVSDTGGITSDVAILCREIGIPCVVGTQIGTKMLKQGENVLVDGSVGAIYGKKEIKDKIKKDKKSKQAPPKGDDKEENTVNRVKTATKIFLNMKRRLGNFSDDKEFIEPSDGIAVIRMQDVYRKIGRHPEAYIEDEKEKLFIDLVSTEISPYCDLAAGDPVFIGIGSTTVAKYKKLTKGKSYEKWSEDSGIGDKSNGLERLLKNDKEIDLLTKTFRHLRNKKGWREISLSVEYPGTPDMLIELKKKLTSSGLQRSSTFKLYMTVNTPSEAMIIENFKDVDLDGFIINTVKLSRYMQAPSATDPSVLKVVENITDICEDERVIVQLPRESENIIDQLIKIGVYGVSVKADELEDISQKIAEVERSVVFKQ